MTGGVTWWATKVRRVQSHLTATVSPAEWAGLAGWLTPAQLDVFDGMLVADRRHGLDVVAAMRAAGIDSAEALLAGLLHDAGKGRTGIAPRVVHSLGQAYGAWIPRLAGRWPGMTAALERLEHHPETSARLAEGAGCSKRTVELIRWQEAPRDPEFGEPLRLADEAS